MFDSTCSYSFHFSKYSYRTRICRVHVRIYLKVLLLFFSFFFLEILIKDLRSGQPMFDILVTYLSPSLLHIRIYDSIYKRKPWCINQCPWDGRPPALFCKRALCRGHRSDCVALSGCESAYRLLGASRSSLDWRLLSYQRSYGFTVWPLRRSIGQRHLELPVTKCNVALINVPAYESIVGGLRDTASKESSGYCGPSWYEHETLSRDLARLMEVFVVLEPALVFYEELGSGRRNY